MQSPVHLSFEGVTRSDEFEAYVRDRLALLADLEPRMHDCAVVLCCTAPEAAGRRQYGVSIEARVAGVPLPLQARHDHEDNIMVARAYALLAMRRQLVNARQRPRSAVQRSSRRMTPHVLRRSGQQRQAGA